MTKNIETLWREMEDELREKDTTRRPQKIVMISPWTLKVHALDERETQLDLVRETPVDKEDFDESSLPPELLALVKENESASFYPNFVEAEGSGETLEEAIEKMRLKLRLLDYGYILLDFETYADEFLAGNGDDDEIVIELDDDDFEGIDDDDDDFEGIDDDDFEEI